MKKIYFLFIALMAGTSAMAQTVTNGGMETWRSGTSGSSPVVPIHAPTQWYGIDSLIIGAEELFVPLLYTGYAPTDLHTQLWQESTIKHGGSSSAKMMTLKQDTLGRFAGILSNANVNLNITAMSYSFSGGQPITDPIGTVSAWVQYTAGLDSITHLPGIDSGIMTVTVYAKVLGNDSAVGTAMVKIGPSTSFQQITATVNYNDSLNGVFDTVRISFASSGQTGALDSSTLYVDDVTMTYHAPFVNAVKNVNAANAASVYPNPAAAMLYVEGDNIGGANLQVYSVSGQVVMTKTLNKKNAIDITTLPEGLYVYTITNSDNTVQRGKISVVR